jgi:hypothetical protein
MSKMGKRVGPAPVEPVRIGALRVEAVHWGSELGVAENGGWLRAVDAASGEPAWTLQVYKTEYNPDKERDVQDVFITSLSAGPQGLEVTDELERRFLVDPDRRSVTRLGP